MLARNERPFEVPRLAASFVVQAGIASRDEFEFFGDGLDMQGCSQCGLFKIGYVAILFGHG